jgi:hypothetical protein
MASQEVERLRTALALFDDGVRLMRANLRRQHPDASEEDIDRLVGEWLATRPGAEHGDGVGRPRPLPS